MRIRAVAALTLTPPISGLVYAIVGFVARRSVSVDYRTSPAADFVVGCLCGFAFEILELLPFAHAVAKRSWPPGVLWLAGCCLWFAASLTLFGVFYADPQAVIGTSLQMLVPGVALSAAFTYLFLERAHA
jgi:hypothetical protein